MQHPFPYTLANVHPPLPLHPPVSLPPSLLTTLARAYIPFLPHPVEPLHFCELINDPAVIDYSARFDGRSLNVHWIYRGYKLGFCVSFEWDITVVYIRK